LDRDRREQIGLCCVLAALVLTGGASSAWRLAIIAVPLMVFQLPLWLTMSAALVAFVPSAAEFLVYGNWVGALGGRLSVVASTIVLASAVALGLRLIQSRPLRRTLVAAMPYFSFALMVQALVRLWELAPPDWQYLSGNHLSALITFTLVPCFGLRFIPAYRLASLIFLFAGLLLTGSRWGIWVGVVFGLLMAVISFHRRWRYVLATALAGALALPWFVLNSLETGKAGLIQALSGISMLRPWTGLGPGGAEQVSLQFVERTARLTHIESFVYDWPATFGFPFSLLILVSLTYLAFRKKAPIVVETVGRLKVLAAVGLFALLCHDLFDFSLYSGAVRIGMGCLVGVLLPGSLNTVRAPLSLVIVAGLSMISLAAWHHYDPLRMEISDRLEDVPERFGQRSFRYWLDKGRKAPNLARARFALARSLSIAPGNRESWFLLGDILRRDGLQDQGLLAYRRGLESTHDLWSGVATERLAHLPLPLIQRVIGDHLGLAQAVARVRWHRSQREHEFVGELDKLHQDRKIRDYYVRGLMTDRYPRSYVVPVLWRLAQQKPLNEGDGVRFLLRIMALEPRVDGPQLLLRIVRRQVEHCHGIGEWPESHLVGLAAVIDELEPLCREHLLGRSASLRRLTTLRRVKSP
jgi:hypothetical protein